MSAILTRKFLAILGIGSRVLAYFREKQDMSDSFRKKGAEQAAKDSSDMANALRKASAKQNSDLAKNMRTQHDQAISNIRDRHDEIKDSLKNIRD